MACFAGRFTAHRSPAAYTTAQQYLFNFLTSLSPGRIFFGEKKYMPRLGAWLAGILLTHSTLYFILFLLKTAIKRRKVIKKANICYEASYRLNYIKNS